MKIMQLVVYVSPEGVIIAKCDVAPIQSNFYTFIILYVISDFISVKAVGLSVEELLETLIFCWDAHFLKV